MSEYICKFIIFAVNIVLILFLKIRYQINLEACIGILKSIDLHIPFFQTGRKDKGKKGVSKSIRSFHAALLSLEVEKLNLFLATNKNGGEEPNESFRKIKQNAFAVQ